MKHARHHGTRLIRGASAGTLALMVLIGSARGQTVGDNGESAPASAVSPAAEDAPAGDAAVETRDQAMELVEVDWFQEALQGGLTMVALGALCVALVAFIVERAWVMRRKRFVPADLGDRVFKELRSKPPAEVARALQQEPSTLAVVMSYLLRHRHAPKAEAVEGAGDLAARDLVDQEARLTPLSAIAALAPLLGLLGTMIGMIESFKLVEVFGDEGGASMLAGSISKALITTAAGLVIAVPAIVAFYFFKHRLHVMTLEIEAETERLIEVLWPPRESRDAPGDGAGARAERPKAKQSDGSPRVGVAEGPAPASPRADAPKTVKSPA